jgi:hypothetical protein
MDVSYCGVFSRAQTTYHVWETLNRLSVRVWGWEKPHIVLARPDPLCRRTLPLFKKLRISLIVYLVVPFGISLERYVFSERLLWSQWTTLHTEPSLLASALTVFLAYMKIISNNIKDINKITTHRNNLKCVTICNELWYFLWPHSETVFI